MNDPSISTMLLRLIFRSLGAGHPIRLAIGVAVGIALELAFFLSFLGGSFHDFNACNRFVQTSVQLAKLFAHAV